MTLHYSNPALDAELAYRREMLHGGRPRDRAPGAARWFRNRRRAQLTAPARVTIGSVLSEARATIDDVPRWDDAPMVGRAAELARLLAHVDRAVGGPAVRRAARRRRRRRQDPAARRARPRGPPSGASGCSPATASTSATSGCPTCPSSTCCARWPPIPSSRPDAAANPVARRRCSPGGRCRSAPVQPVAEGRDLSRPLPHRAAPQPVDDGRLQLFESVAALHLRAGRRRPAADRAGGRALGRPVQPRPAALPAGPARPTSRSPSSPPTAPTTCTGATRCARCWPSWCGCPAWSGSSSARCPTPRSARWSARLAAAAGSLPESTVDDVVARAEGNAFYAEELLAAGLHGEALPLGLTDVLLARVEQRSPAAQQVLRVAAVAGRRVRHELVAAVGGLGDGDLEAALAEAVHHHLLVVSDDGRYRFRHALLREAVLADLLPGERVRLHAADRRLPGRRRPARRTRPSGRTTPARATTCPARFSASLEAAAAAGGVGAPAEQLQHLEAALALWSAVPDAAERAGRDQAALLLETAAAARTVGELHRAVALLRSALEVLGPDADPEVRARVHYTLAQAMVRVEDDAGRLPRERGGDGARARPQPPSKVRTWAAATHARMSYSFGRIDEARRGGRGGARRGRRARA